MPMLNILMGNYRNFRKNNEIIANNRQFKIGSVYIKRVKFLTGLSRALLARFDTQYTMDELIKPTDELLERIIELKKELGGAAQTKIGTESKVLVLEDAFQHPFPFKEQTPKISPVVIDGLRAVWSGGRIPDHDYMRNELKDLDLIIIPFGHIQRAKVISFIVSLGLDIEVSMVKEGGTLQGEIDFLNGTRNIRKKKKNRPVKHDVVVTISVNESGLSSASARQIQKTVVRCYQREKGVEPSVQINWQKVAKTEVEEAV